VNRINCSNGKEKEDGIGWTEVRENNEGKM
jgi:hypothetical protein